MEFDQNENSKLVVEEGKEGEEGKKKKKPKSQVTPEMRAKQQEDRDAKENKK